MKNILLILSMSFLALSCATANETAEQTKPLLNGQTVNKQIEVRTIEGKTVKVGDIIKKSPSVIVFYRGGWCPYCNKQLARLRKIEKDIQKLGYQLIAVSPDKPSKLQESSKKHSLDYKLISDSKLSLAKSFGLSFKLDSKTVMAYKGYGIDLEEASGEKHFSLPIPAVYIVDKDGLIHFNYVNPNYKTRLNEKVLLTALKELKL